MGASERQANSYSQDALNNIEVLTGLKALEGSLTRSLKGKGSVGDYAATGLTAIPFVGRLPIVRRGARAVDEALMGQRLTNQVVPTPNPTAKSSIIAGRALNSPEQVTFAQRKISTAELEDALKYGRFRTPKEGTKFSKAGKPEKWWSAADASGEFGRPWPRQNTHLVRLPAGKVPTNRAAAVKHAEVFDREAGKWVPFSTYTKKYSIGGIIIDDGNPAKQRKLI
jgi:hypothetical protein